MKLLRPCLWLMAILIIFSFLQSCTKEMTASGQTETELTASGVSSANGKVKQLVLQPGPQDGIDTWLTWQQGDTVLPNTNWDTVNIIAGYAWTNRGASIKGRSLLKFAGLSSIPSSSLVISARLYMYGVPGNLRLTSGNSIYPGTPYYLDNGLTVLRVTGSWDESQATWKQQPKTTQDDRVTFSNSAAQWNYDADIDVTPMVAKMVAVPAKNYGFMFRQAIEQEYKNMMFASSDYIDPAKRPKLIVAYKVK